MPAHSAPVVVCQTSILQKKKRRGIVAFLKWMSSIDTNGFPRGFTPIDQEDGA